MPCSFLHHMERWHWDEVSGAGSPRAGHHLFGFQCSRAKNKTAGPDQSLIVFFCQGWRTLRNHVKNFVYMQMWPCLFSFTFIYSIYLAMPGLSCGMWDPVPQPGIELRPPALGGGSLSHWTTRQVQACFLTTAPWFKFSEWSVAP